MRVRLSNHLGRILPGICTLSFLPILFMLAYLTLPYVNPILSRAAVLSAEVSFLYPGQKEAKASQNDSAAVNQDTLLAESLEPELLEEQGSLATGAKPPHANEDALQLEPIVIPERPEGAGTLIRKTYPSGGKGEVYIQTGAASIKNCTTVSRSIIQTTVEQMPSLRLPENGEPMVLIMHTHATESYQPYAVDWYDRSDTCRTTDTERNVCKVGEEIAKQLELAGIGVLHDTTLHDYPSYNGAYGRSAVTVQEYLKRYPSIQVVLDVHRDAIQPETDTMVAPVATIDGRSCAQVMIISGCDDGSMNMPNYLENLKLSAALVRNMEELYPGLSRPVLFDYRKYNQDLTTGSILLEMGGHANTLEEAAYAGELVGKSLAKTLLALR